MDVSWSVCLGVFGLRLANALSVRTFFDPDEHYQGHEIAHIAVFGYGYQSWEWNVGLRSFLHPGVLSLLYWLAPDPTLAVKVRVKLSLNVLIL